MAPWWCKLFSGSIARSPCSRVARARRAFPVPPRWCKLPSVACRLGSGDYGVPAVVQAVFWYVRWARGNASRFPVRAVASRWCKLFSGTCGGPAVVTSCFPTSWGHLGASWGAFRASWSGFLIIFGIPTPSEAQFEPPGAIWAPLGGLLGPPGGASWGRLGGSGASWDLWGPPRDAFGRFLGPPGGLLGAAPAARGAPHALQKHKILEKSGKVSAPPCFH